MRLKCFLVSAVILLAWSLYYLLFRFHLTFQYPLLLVSSGLYHRVWLWSSLLAL